MKIFRFIVFVLFFSFYFLVFTSVHAQDAPVPNPPVPCNQVRPDILHPFENEFHSLRPYQASATCVSTVSNYARFCGNELTLKDTVRGTYHWNDPNCYLNLAAGRVYCDFNIRVAKPITIDLSGADLPIMGNTEEVTNYKGKADQFDDAQKVNEYVSWYLNGVTGKAEYSFVDIQNQKDLDKIVNFSGPLNKLLSWESQARARIKSIDDAKKTRHNQIVACTIMGVPVPCYDSKFLGLIISKHRLSGWKKPPLRENFDSFSAYWKKFKEWRGQSCLSFPVPVLNTKALLCFNNPLKPDYWGNLFQNIPLSSTEDLKGGVSIEKISSADQENVDVDVSNVAFSEQKPADLFFSHMQESDDLASILQDTFVSTDEKQNKTGAPTNVDAASCKMVEVRSNKGDNLFAGEITGTLSYDASFTCDFKLLPPGSPITLYCTKDVTINLSTVSDSPKVDDVWSRLVAGPASIFKRIFPKTNIPGSVGTIIDMPGSTNISYSGEGISTSDTELKLPHLGGIYEYFLKGIQTALRPKGYGEAITFNQTGATTPPGDEINCNQSAPESSLVRLISKQAMYQLALNWVGGKLGNHVLECYNDVIYRTKQTGVNTALSLALWLHESDASNYDLGYVQDFGAYWPGTYPGFVAQINEFFRGAKSEMYTLNGSICRGKSGVLDDFHAWALVYKSGACDPNEPGAKQFYNEIQTTIDWVSDCSTPTSPIDTICP